MVGSRSKSEGEEMMLPEPVSGIEDRLNKLELKIADLEAANKIHSKKASIAALIVQYSHVSREHGGETIHIKTKDVEFGHWRKRSLTIHDDYICRIQKDGGQRRAKITERYCAISDITEIKLGRTVYQFDTVD
jgi:hypothetical protein